MTNIFQLSRMHKILQFILTTYATHRNEIKYFFISKRMTSRTVLWVCSVLHCCRLSVNLSQPKITDLCAQNRMTTWPVPQTPCCHCCDELTACCCRRRLILTLVVNAVWQCVRFKSFLFPGTKYYYWRRGQHVACINGVQLSAIVIRCRLSSVVVVTRAHCDKTANH